MVYSLLFCNFLLCLIKLHTDQLSHLAILVGALVLFRGFSGATGEVSVYCRVIGVLIVIIGESIMSIISGQIYVNDRQVLTPCVFLQHFWFCGFLYGTGHVEET